MSGELNKLSEEFHKFVNDQSGMFLFANTGLVMVKERMLTLLAGADANSYVLCGDGDPSDEKTTGYQRWKIGELGANLSEDGLTALALGHQWLVSLYSHWEHRYRKLFSESLGIPINEFNVPLFGDLRLIRNDIIHNGGYASDKQSKCEVLRWFSVGTPIILNGNHIKEFMQLLGLTFKP